ncbi:DNA repair protein complementing XP-C cells homolog [Dermatophagoides pteronyssinus]|uniref:DNA repair protein complementing XP-C cells homolog n=1 Tax=Dermatophagoides pteronyssinus TaxID=6956 RepID=A0ABQ8JPC1_DERPT|nr:hypothetical protein DERP_004646 [Dermatophagoides pteronyssinus]
MLRPKRKSTTVVRSKYFVDDDGDDDSRTSDDDDGSSTKKRISNKKIKISSTSDTRKKIDKNDKKLNEKKKKMLKKKVENDDDNDSDDSNDDWEEVEEAKIFDPEIYQPKLPEKIQISMNQLGKKTKNPIDQIQAEIRQQINRMRKENQLIQHKCSILFAINRIQYLNSLIQDPLIKSLALSMNYLVPADEKNLSLEKYIGIFITKFSKNFNITILEKHDYSIDLYQELLKSFEQKKIEYNLIINLMIISILRMSNQMVRLCYLIDALPIKPPMNLLSTSSSSNDSVVTKSKSKSTENDETTTTKEFYWIEIFDNDHNRWICYDYHPHRIYDKPKKISENFPIKQPTYIFAIDNDGNISEITARYVQDWHSNQIRKRRLTDGWLEETLNIFDNNGKHTRYKEADNLEFEKISQQIELPKKLSDYKNHPLFVLEKDLLKYQAIYPPDSPPLGFFRNQPVYSRNCVHILKSRETWLRDARTVKPDEQPYKIVQSRFKWKVNPGEQPEKEMIGVYGEWQTQPFEPPIARNGQVPRNNYGNVDLFKKSMLPIGTVHLQLPGLLRLANRLKIDCVPAIVGFEGTCSSHPVLDGYVVCKEYKDILIDAWQQDQKLQREREQEKCLKRIMENWKRLISGLIIKRKLKIKYG